MLKPLFENNQQQVSGHLNQSYDHQDFFEDSFPNSARQPGPNDQSFNVELNTSEQFTVDDSEAQNSQRKR